MVHVISVRTSGDLHTLSVSLNRIRRKVPTMTRKEMRRWGNILERDMKNSARLSGIRRAKGELSTTGIDWRQGPRSDHGELFMRIYGIYLDLMGSHWVSVTRRRTRLLAWAKQARSSKIREKATSVEKGELKSFGIYVHKHPFIQVGYRRARPKLRSLLKRAASKGVAV